MKKRIAIDMDEVLVDTAPTHLLRYNETFSADLTPSSLAGVSIYDAIPQDRVARTRAILEHPGFFLTPEPMPGSREAVAKLMETHEIFIATAAMEFPSSFSAKFDWLATHFPMVPPSNIVFCGDKSILATDYLIDDTPRHFERFRGSPILFTAPHNLGETRYTRANNWREVESLLLR